MTSQNNIRILPEKGPSEFHCAVTRLGGKPSAWRMCIFDYLKRRANIENRVWLGVETIARDLGCSKNTVTKCLQELINIQAIIEVPYEERSKLQKHLKQAKKVWQLTGYAVIDNEEYWYHHKANIPLSGNLFSHSVIKQLSGNESNSIKEKEESNPEESTSPPGTLTDIPQAEVGGSSANPNGQKKAEPEKKVSAVKEEWFDPYLSGQPIEGRIDSLRNESQKVCPPPEPRPKTKYKKSEAYQHLERIVKHVGNYGKSDGILLGQVLRWLWVDIAASYADVLDFAAWYTREQAGMTFVKKLQGNGGGKKGWQEYWQEWQKSRPLSVDDVVARYGKASGQ